MPTPRTQLASPASAGYVPRATPSRVVRTSRLTREGVQMDNGDDLDPCALAGELGQICTPGFTVPPLSSLANSQSLHSPLTRSLPPGRCSEHSFESAADMALLHSYLRVQPTSSQTRATALARSCFTTSSPRARTVRSCLPSCVPAPSSLADDATRTGQGGENWSSFSEYITNCESHSSSPHARADRAYVQARRRT